MVEKAVPPRVETAVTVPETVDDDEDEDEGDGPDGGGASSAEASIDVFDPEGHKTVFALDRVSMTFGRDEKNHVCLPDKKASRKHFLIEAAGDYFNAIDLGSTNGLRVNGVKIGKRRLREGDELTVGQYRVVYHGPTDESAPDEIAELQAQGGGQPSGAIAAPSPAPPPQAVEEEDEAQEDAAAPRGRRRFGKRRRSGEQAQVQAEPEPEEAAPEPAGDEIECPECNVPMGEDLVCPECGYKALKLRAIEHYVDHIARGDSLLGGLGLWKLKRDKVFAQCFELPKVKWVLEVKCPKCGKRHREINEFRVRCVNCEDCGAEVKLPVTNPPRLQ
ncbi:MAG: FHA domain-containing protein [Planctomycetota bacterium]|nr:FHA domain-containing protein [Planctomycetota bacterium]